VDGAIDESVETGEGPSTAGSVMVGDVVDSPDPIAGEAATADEQWGASDVATADPPTITADEATDDSVGTGHDAMMLGNGIVATGLVIATEGATTDQPSRTSGVIPEDEWSEVEADGEAANPVIVGEAATIDQPSGGPGVVAEDEWSGVEADAEAANPVIVGEAATVDQPSGASGVIAEDEWSGVEADFDAIDPVLVGEAATIDQRSGTDEAATEDKEPTTTAAVPVDDTVAGDEARTHDQAGITNAATSVDDTTMIIPAVVDDATTIMPTVPDGATTIIPAVPDDIPVVPPLGRLRLADQPVIQESGKQASGGGTGAATVGAPTTTPTETAKPKAAAVPVTVPAPTPAPATPVRRRPRRARLKVTRADPWSVMKIAFILSLAAGIMTVVAVAFLWMALDAAGVFSKVGETVNSVTSGGEDKGFDLEGYLTLSRVLGITGIIAAVEVVVMTALATLLAFMYNVSSGMVGGVEVTLAEDD
jgi:hypothetical protein